jgi:signal transduction histidine kinase
MIGSLRCDGVESEPAHPMTSQEQSRRAELEKLGFGDHVCLGYRTLEELVAATVTYLCIGLERHEQCVFFTGDDSAISEPAVLTAVRAAGVDLDLAFESGDLRTARSTDTFPPPPLFEPDDVLFWLDGRVNAARAAGYSGLRLAGEACGSFTFRSDAGRFPEFEAKLNGFVSGRPVVVLCLYDRARFPAAALREIIATHPLVLARGMLCENPYFVPPERYLSPDREREELDWVLLNLEKLQSAHNELRESERRAREALRLRDEFLTAASHELYTPMTSLMLSLEALSRGARSGQPFDETSARSLLDVLLRQGRRLVTLAGDLLSVSRIETGRLSLDPCDADLAELVHEVVQRFVLDTQRSGSSITVRAGMPVRGRWDRARLEQVVTNLVSNAIKFGEQRPIEIAIEAKDGIARLAVTDRGIGIEDGSLGTIFERFHRGVPIDHYGGLGLGLYISRRIVEAHGGSIRVESAPGQGATFTVELPCAACARQTPLTGY